MIWKSLTFLFFLIPVVLVMQLLEKESDSIPCSLLSKDLLAGTSTGFLSEVGDVFIFSEGFDVSDWRTVLVGMIGNSLEDSVEVDVTDCSSFPTTTEETLLLSVKSGVAEVMKLVDSPGVGTERCSRKGSGLV